jgi:tetratricopeptide (TPR) repeat protein
MASDITQQRRQGRSDRSDSRGGPPEHIKAAALLRNRAVALVKDGRPREAEALLDQAIGIFPGFAEAEIRIGNIRRDLGDSDTALERYRRALAIKPDYAWAHLEMGICRQRRGETEAALGSYRRALRHNPRLYKTVLFALVSQPRGPFWLNVTELKRLLTQDMAGARDERN